MFVVMMKIRVTFHQYLIVDDEMELYVYFHLKDFIRKNEDEVMYLVFERQLENFFLVILRFYYLFDEILFLMNVIDEYIEY